jgi:hypothetical protein
VIEVCVVGDGWREFPKANAWGLNEADGTLRLVETGGPPNWEFRRWVAVFPSGGWTGLAYGADAAERREYGFKLSG